MNTRCSSNNNNVEYVKINVFKYNHNTNVNDNDGSQFTEYDENDSLTMKDNIYETSSPSLCPSNNDYGNYVLFDSPKSSRPVHHNRIVHSLTNNTGNLKSRNRGIGDTNANSNVSEFSYPNNASDDSDDSTTSNHSNTASTTMLSSSLSTSMLSMASSANASDKIINTSTSNIASPGNSINYSTMKILPANITAPFQLLFGAAGIFITYLYYGLVQEDLFRYRDPIDGSAFTYIWYLQMAESSVTLLIGYYGKRYCSGQQRLQQENININQIIHPKEMSSQQSIPTFLFFQSGTSQLLGKAFMAMSLSAGLSFPVVVLAKSAKVVPVMLGQFVLGGSNYKYRDYIFAVLIVLGTAMLSFGSSTDDGQEEASMDNSKNTGLGLTLIFLSLVMDGVTGGLQKKLKQETKHMTNISTYDFLFYSHTAMFSVAAIISIMTGEFARGHTFLLQHLHDNVVYLLLASCFCSAIGQCFIFYVIATFDPLVCTTVTTTRKMVSVLFSICFKGHHLKTQGMLGLLLGISALFIEVEGQFNKHITNKQVSEKQLIASPNAGGGKKIVSITPSPTTVNLNNDNDAMVVQQQSHHHHPSIV